MTQITASDQMNLFRDAFQYDIGRFYSNRLACYLREGLYAGANVDSFTVVMSRYCNEIYDEFFLKSLHRLICSMIDLEKSSNFIDEMFELLQKFFNKF